MIVFKYVSVYYYAEPHMEDSTCRLTKINSFEMKQYSTTVNGISTYNSTQLRPESIRKSIKAKKERRRALYLDEGQAHAVWKPKRYNKKVHVAVSVHTAMLEMEKYKQDLHERQQKLLSRVQATREVLKVQREELATLDEEEKIPDEAMDRRQWRNVITRVMEENGTDTDRRERRNRKKQSMYFHNIVSQYVAAMTKQSPSSETAPSLTHNSLKRRAPSYTSLKVAPLRTGVMPLRQWKSLVFEDHHKINTTDTSPHTHMEEGYPSDDGEETRFHVSNDEDMDNNYEADKSKTVSLDDFTRENVERHSADFTCVQVHHN